MSRVSPLAGRACLLSLALLLINAAVGIGQMKDRPCAMTFNYNQTVSMQYQVPGTAPPKIITFPFYFGVSQAFTGWLTQGATGYYPYGTLTSTGGAAQLVNAQIPANCYYLGQDNGGGDTTWLAQASYGYPTGDLEPLYNADEQQYCNGIPVDDNSNCVDNGEGGGGATYGDGDDVSGGGYLVCRWTDYYDDNWVYLYTVDHGCYVI